MLYRKQAIAAGRWLASLPLPPTHTEAHIQRLFGTCAALALDDTTSPGTTRRRLEEIVGQLRPFVWSRYTGDPVFVLSLYRLLTERRIFHQSLKDYYDGCKQLPVPHADGFDSRHSLFLDLIDTKIPHPNIVGVPIPPIGSLVQDGRSALIEVCRTIMMATSCGLRRLDNVGCLPGILPKLCCSYATDWDIAATCILLRTCAYLGVSGTSPCCAAKSWLLDQQRSDGLFGLIFPKDLQDERDPEEPDANFFATTDVLWTLAELDRPGFMLGNRLRRGSGAGNPEKVSGTNGKRTT